MGGVIIESNTDNLIAKHLMENATQIPPPLMNNKLDFDSYLIIMASMINSV